MTLPIIKTHQIQGGNVEPIQWMDYTAGQTFKTGELLKFSSGSLIVMDSGVSAATLVGVALQDADSGPGFSVANSSQIVSTTGRSQKVSVIRPNDNVIFSGSLTNSSNVAVIPAVTDIGVQYGLTAYNSAATGAVWTVDKAKTGGSAKVVITGIDTTQNLVFFKFLVAFLA